MSLRTDCPECGRQLKIKERLAGAHVRCPACHEQFTFAPPMLAGGRSAAAGLEAEKSRGKCPVSPRSKQQEPPAGRVGRFQLKEALGQGSLGVVYRAHDRLLDREVALKVVRRAPGGNGEAVRVMREAKSAVRLRHPHIVAVFEVKAEGRCYAASEYIPGKALSDAIRQREESRQPINFREAATWIRGLAGALAYAHGQGIIHRGVNPQNVIIDLAGRPQLTDFGLTWYLDDHGMRIGQRTPSGAVACLSPEQACGDAWIGPASDQYGLGATLYELLTGCRPFQGSEHKVLMEVIGTPPLAPRSLRPQVPKALEAICLKAMSKDPHDRYADCQEMADDLDRWLAGDLVRARRHGPVRRLFHAVKRHPFLAAWTAAAVVMLALGALTFTLSLLSDFTDKPYPPL